jgi:hypothetical protein
MNRAKDDFIMGIPLAFFHYFIKETETDGLVGEDSTKFGEYKGLAFNDSISHSEIIDFFVTKKKRDRIYKFYSHICLDLAKRGF